MSRVDVPTLRCDRCRHTTQDLKEMSTFRKLQRYHQSGSDEWDLCSQCWAKFTQFLCEDASKEEMQQ